MKSKKSQLEVELDILVQEIESAGTPREKPVNQKNRARRQRKANLRKQLNSTITHNDSEIRALCALCSAMSAEDGRRLFYCAGCRNTRSFIARFMHNKCSFPSKHFQVLQLALPQTGLEIPQERMYSKCQLQDHIFGI